MSSFGGGYVTRSDEEGFGGIYGGKQEEEEKIDHGNYPGKNLHWSLHDIYIYTHTHPLS